jgi:hypothetical protein
MRNSLKMDVLDDYVYSVKGERIPNFVRDN